MFVLRFPRAISDFFERCSGAVCFHWPALFFSPKNLKRAKKGEGKGQEKENDKDEDNSETSSLLFACLLTCLCLLLCPEGPLDRFGTTFGIILESFWGHFELLFGVFSKMFPCCFRFA